MTFCARPLKKGTMNVHTTKYKYEDDKMIINQNQFMIELHIIIFHFVYYLFHRVFVVLLFIWISFVRSWLQKYIIENY